MNKQTMHITSAHKAQTLNAIFRHKHDVVLKWAIVCKNLCYWDV